LALMETDLSAKIAELIRQRFGAGAEVSRVEPLAGDASTRRYARAWLRGAGTPPTAVIMILADRGVAMSSNELAVFKQPLAELPYVNVHRFLEPLGVAVPDLYLDASENGLLVLEDVGDVALRDMVEGKPREDVEALFAAAIDQLLLMQIEGTAHRRDDCLAFQQAFDERLFLWEFEHFIEYGLCGSDASKVTDDELAALRRHFGDIARFLDAQPRYLNHRDFHGWNLFVHDGRIRVLDFQDALLAPAPYDLATLLGDRDTPQVVPAESERRLLDYYRRGWAAQGGPAWDPAHLWKLYAMCALQKAFKVVGRFHYLNRVKNKPGYLRYLPPTLRQIGRLLPEWPGGTEMREILGRHFTELRQ
jgi:N-acetylmuramate 1-kinase